MEQFNQVSILDFLDSPELLEEWNRLISTFTSRNPDIERFLKFQSVESAKAKRSVTYLILDEIHHFAAYFALALKPFVFFRNELHLSRGVKNKLLRTVSTVPGQDEEAISVFLIAQLGKNYSKGSSYFR